MLLPLATLAGFSHNPLWPLLSLLPNGLQEGDVEAALGMVEASSGLQRTRQLAAFHAAEAVAAVQGMSAPATQHAAEHRAGLLQVTQRVLDRKK